jgi:hypothetical protein
VTFEEWLELAESEPRIVGVVVTGSRGRNAFVHGGSDWDLRLAGQEGQEGFAETLGTPHGSIVEVVATTLERFRSWPAWDRYSFAHAAVPVDKLDGEFTRVVDALGALAQDEASTIAREALGGYTNSLYRSLKNAELHLDLAARLDAAESVSAFLTAAFALEQRVRPFHKYLTWELEAHPLDEWNGADLVALLADALTGDASSERALFREAEPRMRAHGFGDVIDDWEPHIGFLRGE